MLRDCTNYVNYAVSGLCFRNIRLWVRRISDAMEAIMIFQIGIGKDNRDFQRIYFNSMTTRTTAFAL